MRTILNHNWIEIMDDDKMIAYETNKPIEYVHVSKKKKKKYQKEKNERENDTRKR